MDENRAKKFLRDLCGDDSDELVRDPLTALEPFARRYDYDQLIEAFTRLLSAMRESIRRSDLKEGETYNLTMTPDDVLMKSMRHFKVNDGDMVIFEVDELTSVNHVRAFRRSVCEKAEQLGWTKRGIMTLVTAGQDKLRVCVERDNEATIEDAKGIIRSWLNVDPEKFEDPQRELAVLYNDLRFILEIIERVER